MYTRFDYSTQHIESVEPVWRIREPIEVVRVANRMTIAALNELDQLNNLVSTVYIILTYYITLLNTNYLHMQNTKFIVRATIAGFNLQNGWWYHACPECYKRVQPSGPTWFCRTHAQLKLFRYDDKNFILHFFL